MPRRHSRSRRRTRAERAKRGDLIPAALGGLGLRSAVRKAPDAYWAALADALPKLQKRSRWGLHALARYRWWVCAEPEECG